jgi:hypothetical protein
LDIQSWKKSFDFRDQLVVLFLFLTQFMADTSQIAQRTESMNNVKNLALAQKNFCSQNDGLFAAPTLLNDAGEPVHGWVTQLLPMIDQSALYERIDKSLPWDHPDNQEYFRLQIQVLQNPSLEEELNSEGYPLSHYTLNTRMFPKGQSLTEDYVSRADGLSSTILMGEIQEGLMPWGAPGNARDPALGLKPGLKTMGVDFWGGWRGNDAQQ